MSYTTERERSICNAINFQIQRCVNCTTELRARWTENRQILESGTPMPEKEDWQSKISVNKYAVSIRSSVASIIRMIISSPNWYELEPQGNNPKAERMRPAFEKLMGHRMDKANFKEHLETALLTAFTSMSTLVVDWRNVLKQNPIFILKEAEKQAQKEARKFNAKVANPLVPALPAQEEMAESLSASLDSFVLEAQGETVTEPKVEEFVVVGELHLRDAIDTQTYWEPTVQYMNDSPWRADKWEIPLYSLYAQAEALGISKDKLEDLANKKGNIGGAFSLIQTFKDKYHNRNPVPGKTDIVELTYYAGPLVENNKVTKPFYYALIANNSVILKDGVYPFFEPDSANNPYVTACINRIPYKAVGAGIGENAIELQKTLDSNLNMAVDSLRLALCGVTVSDASKLVDQSQLDEGTYPGMNISVKDTADVRRVFNRVDIASPLTNQVHPVNNEISSAFDQLTGVNELQTGGNNPYSRTSATESEAKLQSGANSTTMIAYSVEQSLFIPFLKKVLARELQFGIPNIMNDAEALSLLTPDEQQEILSLSTSEKLQVISQWYNYKINGLSAIANRNEKVSRDNEMLQIIGSNPIFQGITDIPALLKEVWANRGVKNPAQFLLTEGTPTEILAKETELLMSNHLVIPAETDDHKMHLEQQGPIAQSPWATDAMKQHVQYHMQMLQALEMAQAQQQPGGEPVQ